MREDWIECTLGETIEIVSGKNQKNVINENGKYPIYGSGGIIGRANEYLCEPGTTIIGRKGTINSPIYVNEKFWNVDTAFGFQPTEILNNRLLYFFCVFFNFKKLDKSTTIPSLAKRDLLQIKIPLPPLVEQKAIVTKIEELFSSLDCGIADLQKAKEQLKIYRQAVLKKAFEGNWELTEVGELFDFIGGGTPNKREKKYWHGKIPWASVKDIKGDYLIKTQDSITKEGLKNSSTNLALKDEVILITRISPGKSLITTIDTAINQDLKVVKPKTEMFNKYINYLLKSIERTCIKLSSGTTVKGINLTNLKSIEIPLIGLRKQHQIVQEIESRLSVCDKVEESIKESLNKAQALRQSILKKAFEGTLLSEDEIAACKAHPDYEPTSVLLEKIKTEKKKA